MKLVTGRTGEPHVTSEQDRMLNQGVYGEEACILQTGRRLNPEVKTSNEIRIRDGAIVCQGALGCVETNTYDSVTIQNGNQGMNRVDLIVWRYRYDQEQDKESADWAVVQGTPTEGEAQRPDYTKGNIQEGDAVVEFPVYEVKLEGINITEVNVIAKEMPTIDELNRKLNVSAADIISFTPLAGQNYPNWGGCYYYTSGIRVHVHLGIQALPANKVATVFTLPEALRPKNRILSIGSSGSFPGISRTEISLDGGINVTSQDSYVAADIDYDTY